MKTKTDIQIELLQEIEEICLKNNLNYVLAGENGLNAYLNHTIKNGPIDVSVAMTQGDIDRFCEIIEKEYKNNRYVEGIFNSPKYNPFYVSYGNKNTTYFNVVNIDNRIHHGIQVRIYPIRKAMDLNGNKIEGWTPKLKRERKLRQKLNKRIESNKFWREKLAQKVLNIPYSLTGGGKRYYNEVKKNIFIDKWEDIQKYSKVRIINKEITTESLKEIQKYEVDNIELSLPESADTYFSEIFGKNFKEKNIKAKGEGVRVIIDTQTSYEDIIKESKDLILEAKALNEEIDEEANEYNAERKTTKNLWHLVNMTDDQIKFIEYSKDRSDALSKYDLDNEDELDIVYNELKPIISSLRKYSKFGMTYSINPEIDALIENLLLKKNKKLLNKIKKIKKEKYFVK